MEFTIHLYGYAQHMFNTLNAIAMFRNSTLYPAAINTMALMVTMYYAISMAGSRSEGEWRQYAMKILGMIVLINALLLPVSSMTIVDHVEKKPMIKVDHIPLAFALPIGLIEQLGYLLTVGFEQAFSVVNGRSSFNYHDHGTAFGARLSKEVMQSSIRNPHFTLNMKNFIERCVIVPAMIGSSFTKEELVSTKDMWKLVSENAGTLRRTPMVYNDGKRYFPSPTCKEAVPYFEKAMQQASDTDIIGAIAKKFRLSVGAGASSQMSMNSLLQTQIKALYPGSSGSVSEIIKHNIMINSLNSHRSAKYPAVKAQLQHEAAGLLSGEMASRVLTGSLGVFKNLIYGSFIFIMPLMLLAGGMAKYRGWITICLSLQLWPPLFAMLNMMIDTAYDPAHIVSYSAWSTELEQMDSIASIAANLTLLIPILAVYVTRMGEGGFLHIAGSLMAASQNAVGSAASEQASGGQNYDNSSVGNSNRNNVNENKFDDSRQFVSGTNSGINPDGSMQKTLPNGNVITVGGAAVTSSVGEASYSEGSGINTALNKGLSDEIQATQSESASLSDGKEKLVSMQASAMTSIAESTRTDGGYNIDQNTDEGKELVKVFGEVDRMTESSEKTWRQNVTAYIRANATVPFGGKIASLFGINIGGGVEASSDISNQDTKSTAHESSESIDTRNSTSESLRKGNHSSWLESNGVDKTQQEHMSKIDNNNRRLEKSIAAHKDKTDRYHNSIDHVRNNSLEYRKDMTQDVVGAYKKQYNVGDREAAREVLSGSQRSQDVFHQLSGEKANEILQRVNAGREGIDNSTKVSDFHNRNKEKLDSFGANNSALDDFKAKHQMSDQSHAQQRLDDAKNQFTTPIRPKQKAYNADSEDYVERVLQDFDPNNDKEKVD